MTLHRCFAALLYLSVPITAAAQTVDTSRRLQVVGTVRSLGGHPRASVNVFIVETLDGALSDSSGRFSFATRAVGTFTLATRSIGFESINRLLNADSLAFPLQITIVPLIPVLAPVRVAASSYSVNNERGATLSSIDVVTTPGSAADVYRAIQLLPGLQSVDEGTGLYVRGGDFTETRVFLNDAALLNPEQLQTALGTFVGRIDPFQLDGIYFSSGGFSARYGDALSGIAALRTLGIPEQHGAQLSAAIGHISAGAGLKLGDRGGVRVAGNFSDLRAFLRLNGSPHEYSPAPRSQDASVSLMWRYRDSAQINLFLVKEDFRLGVGLNEASYSGMFRTNSRTRQSILSWRDKRGALTLTGSAALSDNSGDDNYGVFRLSQRLGNAQMFLSAALALNETATARAGAEFNHLSSSYQGSLPEFGHDASPGARSMLFTANGTGDRTAAFGEVELRFGSRLHVTAGARTDRSSLTNRNTFDPRLSAAVALAPSLTVMLATGNYHQVPDPLAYVDSLGLGDWPSMRATQHIIAIQAGGDARLVRAEFYTKEYRDLVAFDADYQPHGNGEGRASGADLLIKTMLPFRMSLRGVLSAVRSRRSDPATGIITRAPFDIPRSASLVLDWRGGGFTLATGYRVASGRPFTPVTGATHDAANDRWIPIYGTPMSEHLPSFKRMDISLSHLQQSSSGLMRVIFVSVSNVFNHENIANYYYTPDYTQRLPTPGIFNRSAYFGCMFGIQ